MKCACRDPKCTIEIRFDAINHSVMFEREDVSILAYLDANATVNFINELHGILDGFTSKEARRAL